MNSSEIRQLYLDFFESKQHSVIPSASLVPENDPSLLFTNSGMSPLVPYLLGEQHPEGTRLVNSQKSFRAEDIEEVGDNRHNTFFEMLGNWSLGDYFKEDQLNWWFEFLIEKLKLDPERLYQTVYTGNGHVEKDDESIEILKKIYNKYGVDVLEGPETKEADQPGFREEVDFNKYRIFAYCNENWWKRGDAVGELGGPDSETFYDTGKEHNPAFGKHCHPNCECGRFIEIGNSVFMQYQKTESGWKPLKNKNVDFGGGLERITMIVQNKDNIFETDLFINIINKIEELSGKKYRENIQSFEVIADHLKAAVFIMGDDKGIAPSNVDQGYIARRLIRRAIRHGKQLDIRKGAWIEEVANIVVSDYADVYPELSRNLDFISENLEKEEKKFIKTLEKGLKILEKYSSMEKEITGNMAFDLYQTYGFPIEMTKEEIGKKGKKIIKEAEFAQALVEHQKLSRTASEGKFKGGLADTSEKTKKLHTAAHLLLAALRRTLGDHIKQKGSNITSERLRFDFSHPEKITDQQIKDVEILVNEAIIKDLQVSFKEMSLQEAQKIGAMGVFESKYGEKVKVYTIGEDNDIFSKEICGGPHAGRTGELGHFKIIKEQSSSAGVRRIKAIME